MTKVAKESEKVAETVVVMRRWQLEARRKFKTLRAKGQADFLLLATPAAGKTVFALRAAKDLFDEGKVERLVVVCPREAIKAQWAEQAEKFGLRLDPKMTNGDGREAADDDGVVVTYQQVAAAPDLFRMGCQTPTAVVLDEIHHVAGVS
jgi:superfamily II DNA or RNA helicase